MVLVREEGGSFYLRSPDEYRKLAEDNVRGAEASGIPRAKALSAVSQTLLRLAREAEARQSGLGRSRSLERILQCRVGEVCSARRRPLAG